ncbi:MAG: hypothetical protein LBF90_02610 [Prevotellaceae bacterium]|jgi:hypothetical protein|nr:hypothetical protein [Prevotellaceae bacterium]
MKKILLITVSLALLTACAGSDDSVVPYTRRQITVDYTREIPLSALHADTTEIPAALLLSNVLEEQYAKMLLRAHLEEGSVAIEGLSTLGRYVALDSLCISIKDRENKITPDQWIFYFGDIRTDRVITNPPALTLIETLFFYFNNYAKTLDLIVSYRPNDTFERQEGVRLKIRFKGTYDYAEMNE